MKLCSKFVLYLLLLNSFIFLTCKSFWGYDYDADPIPNSATITGRITNLFTKEPVYDAQVQVASQSIHTDEDGKYTLHYLYESDEEQNKRVPITISAANYFSYSNSIIIYPQNNFFDAQLEYAAPIIQKVVVVDYYNNNSMIVCQALITDYQGIKDISSITVSFFYFNNDSRELYTDKVLMDLHHAQSQNDAFYQTTYFPHFSELPQISFLELSEISVIDSAGYSDSTEVTTFIPDSNSVLFPIGSR